MTQVKLLWKLQDCYMKLNVIKDKFEQLNKKGSSKTINKKLKDLKNKLDQKNQLLEINDKKLKKDNHSLKELNYELKETEEGLYSGNVSDLKQLDYMNKEQQRLKELINEQETKILTVMEEEEKINCEIENFKKRYKQMENEFEKNSIKYANLINELKEKEEKIFDCISDISCQIDKSLLEKFNEIKQRKNNPVAKVIDKQCNGCHMIIPVFILDKLKREKEVTFCENCGRILYYNKEEKKKKK